jgi:hypothetical protein
MFDKVVSILRVGLGAVPAILGVLIIIGVLEGGLNLELLAVGVMLAALGFVVAINQGKKEG